ncbi:MAG TPA: DinB family protein [Pyrinomonadaceae bacterium]|nr:DinB family protein [Pyrinomonadaceae bacterium]
MRPASNEAASYYFNYINRVEGDDVLAVLHSQLDETLKFLSAVSEEKSQYRYAPDKWSLRELLNHVNDTERLFVFRALWFARGFEEPLPSFDQEIAVKNSDADAVSWNDMVDEFQSLRHSTLSFFRSLPEAAWSRSGVASDNRFTVRALAFITAGHVAHHVDVMRRLYL